MGRKPGVHDVDARRLIQNYELVFLDWVLENTGMRYLLRASSVRPLRLKHMWARLPQRMVWHIAADC